MSRIPTFDYPETRRVAYAGWSFVPVCPKCGRFVKADPQITLRTNAYSQGELMPADGEPNATCSRCGRVEMPGEGHFGEDEER